jgi:hypothetical protein
MLLADHAWNTSIHTENGLTDSAITFRKSIWKLADRNTLTWPVCSYRSTMSRILLSGFNTCDLELAPAGAGSSPEAPVLTNLPKNSAM